jgi:phospholipid-binding lipoprotein MlaA
VSERAGLKTAVSRVGSSPRVAKARVSPRRRRALVVAVLVAVGAVSLIGASRAQGEDRDGVQIALPLAPAALPAGEETAPSLTTLEVADLPVPDTADRDEALDVAQAAESSATKSSAPEREPLAPETQNGSQDYDPWEPFNDRMFSFNHEVLDRFVLKPAATAWDRVLPTDARQALGRAFDNLGMPRRVVNHLLQGSVPGAAREVARFLLNTTVGVAGLFDVATRAGLEKRDADTGQTLGVYGIGPGPYLVVPVLPPLTVRDAIGYGVDTLLDPLGYFVPLLVSAGTTAGKTVNERSLNLTLFQDVENSVLDLYSAVRNGYLQRRQRAIEQRRAEVKKVLRVSPVPAAEGKRVRSIGRRRKLSRGSGLTPLVKHGHLGSARMPDARAPCVTRRV